MSKTTIVLFVICTAVFVGVAIYTGLTVEKVLYTISHPDTILPSLTTSISQLLVTIQEKWQLVLGVISGGIGTITLLANRIKTWRQTVDSTKEQASQLLADQKTTLETQINDLEATIAAKEQEFATKFNKQAQLINDTQKENITLTRMVNDNTQLAEEGRQAIGQLSALQKKYDELIAQLKTA